MSNLFDMMGNLFGKDARVIELAAIWLDEKVYVKDKGMERRITEGDEVAILHGRVMNSDRHIPTHRIIGCFGTAASTKLHIVVVDILTNEPEVIYL